MTQLFFFKQKTAYEFGTGDWSSDVCSSDLSLIGLIGQARFPSSIGAFVAHPGHASLRSLADATWGIAARMCRIGSGEPRLGTRFSMRSSHFRLLPQTSSGEDDPVQVGCLVNQLMLHPPPSLDGTRCHLTTCGVAERPVCAQQRRQRDVCLSSASGASPRI